MRLVGIHIGPKLIDSGTTAERTAATSTRRAETLCRDPLVPKQPLGRFRDERQTGRTARGAIVAETFTVEEQSPELFAQLDATQRDSVRQALAAGWHEGFTPTREDVENVTDYTRGAIDLAEYRRRGHAAARRAAGVVGAGR